MGGCGARDNEGRWFVDVADTAVFNHFNGNHRRAILVAAVKENHTEESGGTGVPMGQVRHPECGTDPGVAPRLPPGKASGGGIGQLPARPGSDEGEYRGSRSPG